MTNIKKYGLELNQNQEKIILDYLDSLQKYVKKHDLDYEVYNDIEEMFFEKLSNNEKIDDLLIHKSIKEVGKPEDIFGDFSAETIENEEIFYNKMIKNGLVRDNSDAIFLGISGTIAKKLGLPKLFVRLFFLFTIFATFWLYIFIGFLMPIKGEDYSGITLFGFFKKQLFSLIKDVFVNTIISIKNLINYIFANFFSILKTTFSYLIKALGPVCRFLFFSILGLGFLTVLLTLLTFGAFYFSGFSVDNIDFIGVLPQYTIIGIIFGIISSSIFLFGSLAYGVNKKILNKTLFVTGFLSFFIALFFAISTGFTLANTYYGEKQITQNVEFDLQNNTNSGAININIRELYSHNFFDNYDNIGVKVLAGTGTQARAELVRKVYGSEKITNSFQNGINDVMINNSQNNYSLSYENGKLFQEKTFFTFFDTDLVLYLPTDYNYTIEGYNYYLQNVSLSDDFSKYQNYLNTNCYYNNIFYSQEEQKFVCNPDDGDLEEAKKDYNKNFITKDRVKEIIDDRPEGITPKDIVIDLLNRGFELEGLEKQVPDWENQDLIIELDKIKNNFD